LELQEGTATEGNMREVRRKRNSQPAGR